jgi:hypothetical protein
MGFVDDLKTAFKPSGGVRMGGKASRTLCGDAAAPPPAERGTEHAEAAHAMQKNHPPPDHSSSTTPPIPSSVMIEYAAQPLFFNLSPAILNSKGPEPMDSSVVSSPSTVTLDVLPTGWQVSTDNTGKEYYYNKELNVSQWTRPVLRHPVLVAEDKSKSQLPSLIVPHAFQGTNNPVVADDLRRAVPIAKDQNKSQLPMLIVPHKLQGTNNPVVANDLRQNSPLPARKDTSMVHDMTGGPGEFAIAAREFGIEAGPSMQPVAKGASMAHTYDTLSDLKKKLKDRGLSIAGCKPDLIERLR